MFEIDYYHDYISPKLAEDLLRQGRPVKGIDGLVEVGVGGGLETQEAMKFLVSLYKDVREDLGAVLKQRRLDRKFIDERVRACNALNKKLNFELDDEGFKTVLGLEDAHGRVVFGPLTQKYARRGGKPIAPLPDFLKGPHVTLFGPPDSAKMAVNAMNAFHRRLKGEPEVVERLLSEITDIPKWGADDEDSKTPLRKDLVDAAVNLTACFDGNLRVEDGGKKYELAVDRLSLPIKRFPGLALPSTFLFYEGSPIPLHLYDFGLHLFKNWHNERALVFYVPKLENEEEARYIHKMISCAERRIQDLHPKYVSGTVRLMIVLENPRAILRTHEIMDALYPYFAGASLGWHDYLASTARLLREDSHYRIPVKADPEIVIKYIKASHRLLADVVGSRGGIKVGGMYGILPLDNDVDSESFQITLVGFVKDVLVQMKRDLTGFWVAHPDFVRLGMALVEAWKLHVKGKREPLKTLIQELLHKKYHKPIFNLIASKDSGGLDLKDPGYVRSLIVADIKESDFIPNNHPDEIRYNVFQTLQYLTDWLSGNGCVALPAQVNGVAVRVMDDLATAERSRWEVWHEIYHGRFKLDDFLRIAFEEMNFIRKDLSDSRKIVQVKWSEKTEKWYPVAFRLMLLLMTRKNPAEFATELLMPFTVDKIRESADPLASISEIDSEKYQLSEYIARFCHYFEACGSQKYASELARLPVPETDAIRESILKLPFKEVVSASLFHGDIGESKRTLDSKARGEQAAVLASDEQIRHELLELGKQYKKKFGVKFLISAAGKSPEELLNALKTRLKGTRNSEAKLAAEALAEIALKRISKQPWSLLKEKIEQLRTQFKIDSVSLAINTDGATQPLAFGNCDTETAFELASLSKTLASSFALDYFTRKGISIDSPVNQLLEKARTSFRLESNKVLIRHLLNHTALNKHYVTGVSADETLPAISEYLDDIKVLGEPGESFHYSGGGFLVLEFLITVLEKKSIQRLTTPYFKKLGLKNLTFEQKNVKGWKYASGYFDSGEKVKGGRYLFPAFAAGAMGTAGDMGRYLSSLTDAYHSLSGANGISHDIAVEMLHGEDRGSYDFMGAGMGLGVFVAEAGANRFAVHQGANEGFRALFVHCFAGPDRGKGLVIMCNGDNQGVLFIAQAAREILKELKVSGIDFERTEKFDFKNLEQEQIVNLGYKKQLFDSFERCRPEPPYPRGRANHLAEYNLAVDGKILSVTNQRFARAENLLSPFDPTFDPELFGEQGKIMDSWESARHNTRGIDTLIFSLKKPSKIRYVSLSTEYHDGNHPQFARICGRTKGEWVEILPKQKLQGHALAKWKVGPFSETFTEVKVDMFPDGGLTRLGLYDSLPDIAASEFNGESTRFQHAIPKTKKPLVLPYIGSKREIGRNFKNCKTQDLASMAFGGKLIKATNEHYGPAAQSISPYPPLHMFDGLESARSRETGHFEEVTLQLGKPSIIKRIVFDFQYFVNNNPSQLTVEGQIKGKWVELVPKTNVKPFAGNKKEFGLLNKSKISKLRVRMFPDGGINRIHVY